MITEPTLPLVVDAGNRIEEFLVAFGPADDTPMSDAERIELWVGAGAPDAAKEFVRELFA